MHTGCRLTKRKPVSGIDGEYKVILCVCSQCKKRGTVAKRLYKHEYEYESACKQWLGSAHVLDEACEQLQRADESYKEERAHIQQQITELHELLKSFGPKVGASVTTEVQQPFQETINLRSNTGGSASDNEGSIAAGRTEVRRLPAFTDLRSRLEKFSGKSGEGDFEIWLDDYLEATQDCGWSDEHRAHWFSWFMTGPAKVTWQRTLTTEEKSSWESIVAAYKGQFGIHIDPRTPYQHCQELLYEQFNSVQGLMSSMREYQQMAPTMPTDAVLKSIL